MPSIVNMSLENVLERPSKGTGKDLSDDHTVTTRGTSMCSSMRSARTTSSSWTDHSEPRKIHFPEEASTIAGYVPCREELSAEEKWETWWTTSEFQAIRLAAKFTTKHVRKNDTDGIEKIDTGFNTALHVSCTASDEELAAVLRCPPASLCGTLEGWCKRKSPVRGLEKYISNLQKELRLQYVAEARSAVVSMTKSGEHDDEDISMIYKEYSRHALVYARFLAHADMLAAQEDEDEVAADKRPRLVRRLSGFGRQASQSKLVRDSSKRNMMTRQTSKREMNRQASMKKLTREQSSRKLDRENSSKMLLSSSSHHRGGKLQKEPSNRKLTREGSSKKLLQREGSSKKLLQREGSSKKLQREGSSRRLSDHAGGALRRQPSRRGVHRTSTPHDLRDSLAVTAEHLKQKELLASAEQ